MLRTAATTSFGIIGALAAAAAIAGCRSAAEPAAVDVPYRPGFAVFVTGYEVPEPEEVPFDDEERRQEYLRFYHQSYLTTMWDPSGPFASGGSIMPISEHPRAATQGHYDGQEDAHGDKAEYWRARGVSGPESGPWLFHDPPPRD